MKFSRHLLITGIVCGILLTLAPLAGILGTVLGMAREFDELSKTLPTTDPATVSSSAGISLLPTIVSVLLCPVGIALLLTSLKHLRRLTTAASPSPMPVS